MQFHLDSDGFTCDKCYEESVLEKGQPRENFEEDRFGGGSDFSHAEILEKGYKPVENWQNVRCSSKNDAIEFNTNALTLIDDYDAQILTRVIPLDCFCWEASVSMYAKFPEKPVSPEAE